MRYYVRRYFPYGMIVHAVEVTDMTMAVCGQAAPYLNNWSVASRRAQCKACIRKIGDDW